MSDTSLQVAITALSLAAVTFLTALLGRFTYAIKNGSSIKDAVRAVFCGTNTPPSTVTVKETLAFTTKPKLKPRKKKP